MFQYSQSTGELRLDGKLIGVGYSGAGSDAKTGRNNPAMEGVREKGPIPRGNYIIGKAYQHKTKGPVSMNLTPKGHNALGRSSFMIHGNNHKNDASKGCIIFDKAIRQKIEQSGDVELVVIS